MRDVLITPHAEGPNPFCFIPHRHPSEAFRLISKAGGNWSQLSTWALVGEGEDASTHTSCSCWDGGAEQVQWGAVKGKQAAQGVKCVLALWGSHGCFLKSSYQAHSVLCLLGKLVWESSLGWPSAAWWLLSSDCGSAELLLFQGVSPGFFVCLGLFILLLKHNYLTKSPEVEFGHIIS